MASIQFAEASIAALKKTLRPEYPDVRSCHLTEAIAAALGYKTHAALLADLATRNSSHDYELLDDEQFDARLQSFGYPPDLEFSFELVANAASHLIPTLPLSAFDIEYRTERERAWRNLMVLAINEGIRQGLFTLEEDNYRWAEEQGYDETKTHRRDGCTFDFTLPGGHPARAYVDDAGFGELSIHAAVNPTGRLIEAWGPGFDAGDACAAGWLERKTGAWLQSATTQFSCRRHLLKMLANLEVRPRGFGDRGRVIM